MPARKRRTSSRESRRHGEGAGSDSAGEGGSDSDSEPARGRPGLRRLGWGLGLNILPTASKLCNSLRSNRSDHGITEGSSVTAMACCSSTHWT